MNETIKLYFRMKLLETPKRIMNEKGKIVEIYYQPERLNPKDHVAGPGNVIYDSLTFMET